MYIDQVRLGPLIYTQSSSISVCLFFFWFAGMDLYGICTYACTSSKGFRKMECVLVFPTSLACFPLSFQIALCRQSIVSLSSPPPFVSLISLLFSAPDSPKARGVNCTLRIPQDHALLQRVNVAFSEFTCLALSRISYAVTVSSLFRTFSSLFTPFPPDSRSFVLQLAFYVSRHRAEAYTFF